MTLLASQLLHDEAGFIVSAELVLISTILVIGMIVGLSEVANAVNQELEDVASAFGAINQTYCFSGFTGHKAWETGSNFKDFADFCDGQFDITCDGGAQPEAYMGGHHQGW
jgi:Flp pilus assembly pilin Flp